MPAEWEPQAAVWLAWPHNGDTWPRRLSEAQQEFIQFTESIASATPVKILSGQNAGSRNPKPDAALNALGGLSNIEIIDIPTNDAWIRDYGPTFVIENEQRTRNEQRLAAIDWHYNAWGAKYRPFEDDQNVARRIADNLGICAVDPGLCFEGGAIEINNDGLLLTTRSCALDKNRNPKTDTAAVETILARHPGAARTVWLTGGGVDGDDTDGHIDQLARFTDNRTILYAWTEDESDPQRIELANNLEDLRTGLATIDQCALDNFNLIPLPLPANPVVVDGVRLPASYCNFLITNNLVIVPQFSEGGDGNRRSDAQALELIASLIPGKRIVGLQSRYLVAGLGSFHCLTQQQPALPNR